MKTLLSVVFVGVAAAVSATENWLADSTSVCSGTVDVAEGEVKYVRTLDVRNDPLIKTGAGLLAVRDVKGSRKIKVEGGEFATLPPLDATGSANLPSGVAAHLDANAAGTLVYADGSETEITAWKSANGAVSYSAGITSSKGTSGDGNPTVVTDERGKKWIDLGEKSWLYFRNGSEDSSAPLGRNSFREFFAVIKKRSDATHNPAVFGTIDQWQRYFPPGTSTVLGGSPYSPGNNHNAYLVVRNAEWSINGKWVDPVADDWGASVQVVRVSTASQSYFSAFGLDYNGKKGGFLVGEVVCYAKELTVEERVAAERYLLRKWADVEHPYYRAGDAASVAEIEYGAGVMPSQSVASDLTVDNLLPGAATTFSKSGAGTLTVGVLPGDIDSLSAAEGTLCINAYRHKPSAAATTAMTSLGVNLHIDVSDTKSLELTGDGKLMRLNDTDARACGIETNRIDELAQWIKNAQNGLPTMDLGALRSSHGYYKVFGGNMGDTRSFFMVYSRYPDDYPTIASCTGNNLWQSGGSTAFFSSSAGNIYSYGVYSVDGEPYENAGTADVKGGPLPDGFHVFAVHNKSYDWAKFDFKYVGGLNRSPTAGGLKICEIIAGANDARSAARISDWNTVSDYLYQKWIAPKHYSCSSLTVGPSGSIELAGDLTLPAATGLSVGVGADGAGTVTAAGAITVGETGTVTVTVPTGVKPKKGVYPILTGTRFADETRANLANWTLSAPVVPNRTFKLTTTDTQLLLEVGATGIIMVVR